MTHTIQQPHNAKGFADFDASIILKRDRLIAIIESIYQQYGYVKLETPLIENLAMIGKYLPDTDRPNSGVFAFKEDSEWLGIRYDLTAPLARFYAQNRQKLPQPYKRYQCGIVVRNEKPGPNRNRQFYQFDADIIGTSHLLAEAEVSTMMIRAFRAFGFDDSDFLLKVNNREVIDAIFEAIALTDSKAKLITIRAIDKIDRLGEEGVLRLMGKGRKDESGDFTEGANLTESQIAVMRRYVAIALQPNNALSAMESLFNELNIPTTSLNQLKDYLNYCNNYGANNRVQCDFSIVRGLEYYTGIVMEMVMVNEPHLGSVGGGGRYDNLLSNFTAETIPAVGLSIGIDRVVHSIKVKDLVQSQPLVVIARLDSDPTPLHSLLINNNINAEIFLGNGGLKKQFKYADEKNADFMIIEGENEINEGVVSVKNLKLGKSISQSIQNNDEWKKNNQAQVKIKKEDLIEYIKRDY